MIDGSTVLYLWAKTYRRHIKDIRIRRYCQRFFILYQELIVNNIHTIRVFGEYKHKLSVYIVLEIRLSLYVRGDS